MTQEDLEHTDPQEEGTETNVLETLRQENECLKQQVSQAMAWRQKRLQQDTEKAVLQALLRHGAHPDAAGLLVKECSGACLDEQGALMDEEALIGPVKQAWGALFTTGVSQGTSLIDPPAPQGGCMDRNMIRSLSTEEINRDWDLIRQALSRRE